jgi:hexosaminidase
VILLDGNREMIHAVIPAPVRFDGREGRFVFRSGTRIGYTAAALAPIVERFCTEITRRTGLRLIPVAEPPVAEPPVAERPCPDEPSVMIELAELSGTDDLGALPAPLGLSPAGDTAADERHSLTIDANRVSVRAAEPVGVARGLATILQLLALTAGNGAGEVSLPGARILDAPRYAWRGLSLDLVRASFTLDEVRRLIDLLALYKLNVLHLHLTDDQAWRLPVGRPGRDAEPGTGFSGTGFNDTGFYGAEDLRALVAYAADRFVTVVPEVDTPGHATALVEMYPVLNTGRNEVQLDLPPGYRQRAVWLDPELPATFELIEEVLAGVAAIFPGPYLHIGGDEPHGMPRDLYTTYVQHVRHFLRSIGKRPLGWQESARAGLGRGDIIQYWITDIAHPASMPPEVRAQMDAFVAGSRGDVEAAVAASVPVIVSPLNHCYLDVPYAEPSADPAQTDKQRRLGLRRYYSPMTVAESFDWDPAEVLGPGRAAHVAGVEAAIWAETITGFDDLAFLLLPRLPGIACKAWSDAQAVAWADHRDRLARHSLLWAQDDLTYFRSSAVDWP